MQVLIVIIITKILTIVKINKITIIAFKNVGISHSNYLHDFQLLKSKHFKLELIIFYTNQNISKDFISLIVHKWDILWHLLQ